MLAFSGKDKAMLKQAAYIEKFGKLGCIAYLSDLLSKLVRNSSITHLASKIWDQLMRYDTNNLLTSLRREDP